jgi:hypothetical protein
MKVNHPQNPTFLFVLGCLFWLTSCEKTEELLPLQDTAILQEEAQVNASFEDADQLILSSMIGNGTGLRTMVDLNNDLCPDTKIDFYPNNRSIVINFGSGCTSPKGIKRKGKLTITYSEFSSESVMEINILFDGYYVNDLKIEGRRKIIHKGLNEEGMYLHFESVIYDGKVTWPDGTYATIEGEHDKKLYFPASSSDDFRLEVTGGSGGKTRLGIPYMSLIEEKLIFNQKCTSQGNWIPSSGKIELTINSEQKFLIDYGDGACDKTASVTHNGKTVPINFE